MEIEATIPAQEAGELGESKTEATWPMSRTADPVPERKVNYGHT